MTSRCSRSTASRASSSSLRRTARRRRPSSNASSTTPLATRVSSGASPSRAGVSGFPCSSGLIAWSWTDADPSRTSPPAAHQIRVHLQYLGHPIPNDPIYGRESVWSACATQAKGGIDLTPEDDIQYTPDYAPEDALEVAANTATIERRLADAAAAGGQGAGSEEKAKRKLMPRETGEDVGSSSPIKLSKEAREVIRRLRRMKDEQEDWARCVPCDLSLLTLAPRLTFYDRLAVSQLEGRRPLHAGGVQVAGDRQVARGPLCQRPDPADQQVLWPRLLAVAQRPAQLGLVVQVGQVEGQGGRPRRAGRAGRGRGGTDGGEGRGGGGPGRGAVHAARGLLPRLLHPARARPGSGQTLHLPARAQVRSSSRPSAAPGSCD